MWDVISSSVEMIRKNPILLLPQAIPLALTLVGDLSRGPTLGAARVFLSLLSIVVSLVVAGAYPSIVKSVLENGAISVSDALGRAYRRFWPLLAAAILVALVVAVGLIALVVPGLIFLAWYAYTIPALMLEEKGALDAMAASKAFGRDKKWSSLLLFLVFVVAGLVIDIVASVFTVISPLLGQSLSAVLDVPLGAFVSVALAYTYITHGPSSTAAPTTPGYPSSAPMPPQAPEPMVASASSRNCESCGASLEGEPKFCPACGKPVTGR